MNGGEPWPRDYGPGYYEDDAGDVPTVTERHIAPDREGVVHIMRFSSIYRHSDEVRRAEFATVGDACSWYCSRAYLINNKREVVTCVSCIASGDGP